LYLHHSFIILGRPSGPQNFNQGRDNFLSVRGSAVQSPFPNGSDDHSNFNPEWSAGSEILIDWTEPCRGVSGRFRRTITDWLKQET
jgi:hypothetical protein